MHIVDPKNTTRPPADEMVMVMNGYDTDFDTENNFYTVNGISNYYMHQPIEIEKDIFFKSNKEITMLCCITGCS